MPFRSYRKSRRDLLLGLEKDTDRPVFLEPDVRRTHMQIVGATGEGLTGDVVGVAGLDGAHWL